MTTTTDQNRQNPTWEDDIKGLFNDTDISHMKRRGLDLSSFQDVKANAQDIFDSVASGHMPPGNRWPQSRVDLFKGWMDAGTPEGGTPSGGEKPGWNPTSAPEAGKEPRPQAGSFRSSPAIRPREKSPSPIL